MEEERENGGEFKLIQGEIEENFVVSKFSSEENNTANELEGKGGKSELKKLRTSHISFNSYKTSKLIKPLFSFKNGKILKNPQNSESNFVGNENEMFFSPKEIQEKIQAEFKENYATFQNLNRRSSSKIVRTNGLNKIWAQKFMGEEVNIKNPIKHKISFLNSKLKVIPRSNHIKTNRISLKKHMNSGEIKDSLRSFRSNLIDGFDKCKERIALGRGSIYAAGRENSNINLNFNFNININNYEKRDSVKKSMVVNPSLLLDQNFLPSDFEIHKQIGEGTFGKLYSVIWVKNGSEYALKKLFFKEEKELESIKEEIKILSFLNKKIGSEGIIRLFGAQIGKSRSGERCYYILEELAQWDWEKEIIGRKKNKEYYSEGELRRILRELVKVLAKMQRISVVHRDIKPQNILRVENSYKICDFGEAIILKNLQNFSESTNIVLQNIRGTELYMSPLLFTALKFNHTNAQHNPYKSDVFSLGMCFLLAASLTFKSLYEVREEEKEEKIKSITAKYLAARYSYDFINIVDNMLEINEAKRPDFIMLEILLQE